MIRIKTCGLAGVDLVGGSVSVGMGFEVSKAYAGPSLSVSLPASTSSSAAMFPVKMIIN